MAEEVTSDVAYADEPAAFEYPIKVEDAGPATKKVTIEIPESRIQEKLGEQFTELRSQASLPGFRPGHAPRKLIEKKFNKDVRDEVRRTLIRESYQQAVEKNNLQVLGEPEFEDDKALETLPESGQISYTFSVEVQPDFTMPDLGGLSLKRQKTTLTDDHVAQARKNLTEQQGAMIPVEDRGVEEGDFLTADVHLKQGDNILAHQHDARLVARAARLAGLQIDDLAAQLAGAKAGDVKIITVKAPDNFNIEAARGQDVQVEVKLKDIKTLKPAELTPEFLGELGFQNEGELDQALREQMQERIDADIAQSLRTQVAKHLVDNVQMELPTKLSGRQETRVLQRRAMDLMRRGIGEQQIRDNLDKLKEGAADEGMREMKLFFILQKLAGDRNIDVDENELNGQIAMIAIQRNERPEKLKQQMSSDGTLSNLYTQLKEQKVLDALAAEAKVEDVEAAATPAAEEAK